MSAEPVSLQQIMDKYDDLRDDLGKAEAVRRTKERLMLALLVVAVIAIGGMVFIGFKLISVAEEVARTAAEVEDCTRPGGGCYEDGRKRGLALIECGRSTKTEADLQTCVEKKLASQQKAKAR